MSSDTAKENASVVDSSMTEGKCYIGDLDNQESPSSKGNENAHRSGEEENNKTRYFIIKSLNHENIQLSIENGIWATQVMNEPVLEEAYNNSGKVILIFSVNMSGYFQGYAQMISSVGWRRDSVWSQGRGNPWGRSFKVKWLRLSDLPFQKTLHLKNPLNDFKPVKISRDCQELPQDVGEALCELLDGENEISYQNRAPPFYPNNLIYQHQAGLNNFHPVQPENSPGLSSFKRSLPNVNVDYDTSQIDSWHSPSPIASPLTEEDILEMTYEEYLEAHNRILRSSHFPMAGPSWRIQDSSVAKENNDDWYPSCPSNKRPHRQPLK